MNLKYKKGKVLLLNSQGMDWPKFISKNDGAAVVVLWSRPPSFSVHNVKMKPVYRVDVHSLDGHIYTKDMNGAWLDDAHVN